MTYAFLSNPRLRIGGTLPPLTWTQSLDPSNFLPTILSDLTFLPISTATALAEAGPPPSPSLICHTAMRSLLNNQAAFQSLLLASVPTYTDFQHLQLLFELYIPQHSQAAPWEALIPLLSLRHTSQFTFCHAFAYPNHLIKTSWLCWFPGLVLLLLMAKLYIPMTIL